MSKITAEMWEKAIYKLMYYSASSMSDYFKYLVLQDRYNDGERSIELYNAIMELC